MKIETIDNKVYADGYDDFISSCINEIDMLDNNILPIYND